MAGCDDNSTAEDLAEATCGTLGLLRARSPILSRFLLLYRFSSCAILSSDLDRIFLRGFGELVSDIDFNRTAPGSAIYGFFCCARI